MIFEGSKALQRRSHAVIPGGAHTYAKGDDQFPEQAPGFITRGSGCHVWDLDGNEFIEYGMGLRSVTLGHGWASIVDAACRAMRDGVNFNRPTPLEVECAEQLTSMIDGADMVKFAKNGSDATTAAVKLARAHTGRDMVGICVEHPFFSVDDWFIGAGGMPAGIPDAVRRLTVPFRYNDLRSIEELFDRYPGKIACLILEAERTDPPKDGFLQRALETCHRHGALFVLDEIITGFRWHNGGAQAVHHITPDLSAFGKAMGNGFSVSALVGRREIMELGGIRHTRERVFLLSTTYGAETANLAAALETMRIYQREPVVEHLRTQGERLRRGIESVVRAHGVEGHVGLDGHPANLLYYTRDQNKQPSQAFRALFLQELIARGILAPSFVVSYSHGDEDIDRTIEAVDGALGIYRRALNDGVERHLIGDPVKPVMRKFC